MSFYLVNEATNGHPLQPKHSRPNAILAGKAYGKDLKKFLKTN